MMEEKYEKKTTLRSDLYRVVENIGGEELVKAVENALINAQEPGERGIVVNIIQFIRNLLLMGINEDIIVDVVVKLGLCDTKLAQKYIDLAKREQVLRTQRKVVRIKIS